MAIVEGPPGRARTVSGTCSASGPLGADILGRCPAFLVLVNNAAVFRLRRTTRVHGFETRFAVNHLAHFPLTNLLRERLVASAPAPMANVASEAHRFGPLDLDELPSERGLRRMRVDGRSKSANLLFTLELARRLGGTGVTANCAHPGAVVATAPELAGVSGRHFADCREIQPAAAARDPERAARLWEASCRMTGLALAPSPTRA